MTLRHLKIFIAVADSGSMTAASKALFIAQPTVSQAIAELESFYGVKLFERLSKRLYITETGKQVLSYARHITALLAEMEKAVKMPDVKGVLKIGASVTVGTCLLPQLVREFQRIYPLLNIYTVTKNTTDIEGLIIKNEIDFGIVEGMVHSQDIIALPFMDDELVLVCGKGHPLYQAGKIDKSSLAEQNFIVREQGSGTRELFESRMAEHALKWRISWECNGSEGLKSAALHGMGIAVISEKLVVPEVKAGMLSVIKTEGFDLKRKFCIVYHKHKYVSASMHTFFDLCYHVQ